MGSTCANLEACTTYLCSLATSVAIHAARMTCSAKHPLRDPRSLEWLIRHEAATARRRPHHRIPSYDPSNQSSSTPHPLSLGCVGGYFSSRRLAVSDSEQHEELLLVEVSLVGVDKKDRSGQGGRHLMGPLMLGWVSASPRPKRGRAAPGQQTKIDAPGNSAPRASASSAASPQRLAQHR